jgi:hypothetical protein
VKSSTAKPKTKRLSFPVDLVISGVRAVNSYLRTHPDMAEIVPDMCRRAREEFGSTAELTIQINHDKELDDPYLILYVRLSSYAADTRKRIDAVWQHFEKDLRGRSGWIIMTTDFRRVKGDGV